MVVRRSPWQFAHELHTEWGTTGHRPAMPYWNEEATCGANYVVTSGS